MNPEAINPEARDDSSIRASGGRVGIRNPFVAGGSFDHSSVFVSEVTLLTITSIAWTGRTQSTFQLLARSGHFLLQPVASSKERPSTRAHDGSRVQSSGSWRCSRRLCCTTKYGQRSYGSICNLRFSSDHPRARRPLTRTKQTARNASVCLSWSAKRRCPTILPKSGQSREAIASATTRTATYAQHELQRSTTARLPRWTIWARCSTKLYTWPASADGTANQTSPAVLSIWTGGFLKHAGSIANQNPEHDQNKSLGNLLPAQQAASSRAKAWPDRLEVSLS